MALGKRLINTGGAGSPGPKGMTYAYTIPAKTIVNSTTTNGLGIAWDWDRDRFVVCMGTSNGYEKLYTYDPATGTIRFFDQNASIFADVTYDGTYYYWSLAQQLRRTNAETYEGVGGYYSYPDPAVSSARVAYMQGMIMYENSTGNPRIWHGHDTNPYQGVTGNLGQSGSSTGAITMQTPTLYTGGTWDNYDKFWVCDNTGTIRQKTTDFVDTGLTVSSGFTNARSITYMESLQQFAVVGADNGTIRIFDATY